MAAFLLSAAACVAVPARAQVQEAADLAGLSIEELSQVPVRAASKQDEPLGEAPTAIFVLTGDDIIRSAAISLPEALRLAPVIQVQRVDARQYAISARGFNGIETANKLLVLIDGRSVYTPLHSGVFWELHSPLLEDIGQIEVVRGPGGTLFGPNAVNGVVSIVTRDANDTLGGLVRATVGPQERTVGLRYGARLGRTGAFRVYANGFDREDLPAGAGPATDDGFSGWQAGFRADWKGGGGDLTVQGDIFDSESDQFSGDGNRGHNLLARLTRPLGGRSALQVQAYYDDFERRVLLTRDSLQTFDLEAQLNAGFGSHEIVAGAGIRTTRDEFINNLNGFQLDPRSRRLWVFNAFAQDRLALSDRLDLIAGVKLERSSFSGVQVLPNVRLAWRPSDRMLLWAAASRAVRTPSRIDRQLVFLPLLAQATGFESEKLIAFEAGYRGRPARRTTLSVSLFYNLYDDIRTTEFAPGGGLPIRLANSLEGRTWGIEAWAEQQLASWWRLSLGGATLGKDFRLKNGAVDLANRASLGSDPDYHLSVRSRMDLGEKVALDVGLRGQDDLRRTGIGSYVEADARLSWRVSDLVELYVAGQNLLHRTHAESADAARAQLSERSLFAGARLRFQ